MYKKLQITFRNTDDETTKNVVWDIRDNPGTKMGVVHYKKIIQILMQELKTIYVAWLGIYQN